MTARKLRYVSEQVVEGLRGGIAENMDRYCSGDFVDLSRELNWGIELNSVKVDPERLTELDPSSNSSELDIKNSLVVYGALDGLTPNIARDERIWVRLCHVECLDYARTRWGIPDSAESAVPHIEKHFFARTLTQTRDDNALSRLWWLAYIAHETCPEDPEFVLNNILKSADIRMNTIERALTGARVPLMAGIVRALDSEPWLSEAEKNFRKYMKVLNREGGGMLFETWKEAQVDSFMKKCIELAQSE